MAIFRRLNCLLGRQQSDNLLGVKARAARRIWLPFFFCLFHVVFVLLSSGAAFAQGADAVNVEELRYWSKRPGRGTILNPPIGSVDPKIKQTEELIKAIVETLAGERLRAEEYNLVVTIYADETPNAFMAYHGPLSSVPETVAEKNEANSLMTDSVRELYGVPKGKTTYELAITTGLLRLLKSEGELAFVIGHELTHLFEKHTVPARQIQKLAAQWWSLQRFEVIADNQSIKMLVGHYGLNVAIAVLTRLAALHEGPTPVIAVASSHHDEGVRIGSGQAYIEYLHRTDKNSHVETDKPLPEFVKINASKRTERSAKFDAVKEKFLSTLNSHLGKAYSLKYWATDVRTPQIVSDMALSDPTPQQIAELTIGVVQRLSNDATLGPQQRLDTFLRYMSWLGMRVFSTLRAPVWDYLELQERSQIEAFMVSNASQGWSFQKTAAEAEETVGRAYMGMDAFWYSLSTVLFGEDKTKQASFNRVIQSSARWQELTKIFTQGMLSTEPMELRNYIAGLAGIGGPGDSIPGPLAPRLKQEFLQTLREMDLREFAQRMRVDQFDRNFVFPEIFRLKATLESGEMFGKKKYDVEFIEQVHDVLSPYLPAFVEARDRYAREYLKSRRFNPRQLTSFLECYFKSFDIAPPQTDQIAFDSFIKAIRYVNGQRPLTSTNTLSMGGYRTFVLKALTSADVDTETKLELHKFFFATTEYDYLRNYEDVSIEGRSAMRQYLRTLSTEAVLSQLESQYESALRELATLKVNGSLPENVDTDRLGQLMEAYGSSRLSILTFLGAEIEVEPSLTKRFTKADLHRMLNAVDETRAFLKEHSGPHSVFTFHMSPLSTKFMFQIFLERQNEFVSASAWLSAYQRIHRTNIVGVDQDSRFRPAFSGKLTELLERVPASGLLDLLRRKNTLGLLDSSAATKFLTKYLDSQLENIADGPGKAAAVEQQTQYVLNTLKLKDKYPAHYAEFRAGWSQHRNLQPSQISRVFPADERSITIQSQELSSYVRGLSGMVAQARTGKLSEQIEFIEYLMGVRNTPPAYATKLGVVDAEQSSASIALTTLMGEARNRLRFQDHLSRAFIANTFLAGPHSITATHESREALLDYFLRDFRPESKEFARVIGRGVIAAQGPSASLAFAYIFAQPTTNANESQEDREARILNSLFSAFGVPGIKLGQYLAFTSELVAYRKILEALQDSAMPLRYDLALDLLNKRFGPNWPEHYRVVDVIGSGSVNIAIEYEDLRTGAHEVVSVLRDEIETSIRDDFRKFNLLIDSITKDPVLGHRFAYLKGLSHIIEASVNLELDKVRAAQMQRNVRPFYNHKVDGWNVQTIDVYSADQRGLFSQKALGRTARRILTENPGVYREAMHALGSIELGLILGTTPGGNGDMISFFANPDFHDGQVLIDVETKTVTILDFGQAVPITNAERMLGVQTLRLIKKLDGAEASRQFINHLLAGTGQSVSGEELAEILISDDVMDRFVKVLSALSRKGYEMPISTVHWILAVNRINGLSDKIDADFKQVIEAYVFSSKLGISGELFNQARGAWNKVLNVFGQGVDVETLPAPNVERTCSAVITAEPH